MTKKKAPYFKFFAGDWDQDYTQRKLDCAGAGIYIRLLVLQWIEGGLDSDDLESLRTYCGATTEEWEKAWKRLEPKFPVCRDGLRRNPRLQEEWKDILARVEGEQVAATRRSERAKNAANARWSQNMPKQCLDDALIQSDPDPDPDAEEEASASAEGFYWDKERRAIWGNDKARRDLRALFVSMGMTPKEFQEAWNKLNRKIAAGVIPQPLDPGLKLKNWLINFLQNEEKTEESA